MNVCSFFAGLSSAECQNDIWGSNPEARIAGVFAPLATTMRVEGGLVVTGKWPWSSGCLHSDWAMMGVPVVNEAGDPVDQGMAFMPMADCTIEDTWYVAGMKGSGSNTIVANNVFVPDHRLMSVSQLMQGNAPTPFKDEVLYRCAFIPVAALILAGPMMGLCKQALEFVINKAPKRSISYTFYKTQVESPSFQLSVAKAAMLVDTVWMHTLRAAQDIWSAAAQNRFPGYTERARVRMDTGYAAATAREAMDILLSAHGASSFAEVSPLQRMWRDLETCSRHAVVSPEISSEVYGKALLGIQGDVTALV